MPRLRIIEGSGAGTLAPITAGKLTLGREADNDLVVGDPKSSRNHAAIVREGGIWHLHDLSSSNGTWTDAGRVDSLLLSDGTVFRIGRTYLRFEVGDEPEQTHAEAGDPGWLDPAHLEGLDQSPGQLGTDQAGTREATAALFSRQLGGTTTQLARHNTYLVLLHQLVEKSRAAKSRDALFSLLDEAAAEVLDGDRCAVFLPAEAGTSTTGWELWPPHERRLRARYGAVPFARTLLTAVRRHKEPLLCTLLGDLNPSQSMLQAGVRSAMAAPLRLGDEVHALVYVDRIKGPVSGPQTPFTRADLEFLSAVANQLAVSLANLANVARMSAEISRLQIAPAVRQLTLVGSSLAVTEALATKVGASDQPCLIVGETGTGKDLLARMIHQRSSRADKPLQVLACLGLDPAKLELALVGSAEDQRPGVIELADQGTLLIEELGDLPPAVQARLVRLIDHGELVRVGDTGARHVDVRIIATTTRDLRSDSSAGKIRADLIARLTGFTFVLPPLIDRAGDLDDLVEHFLAMNAARLDQPTKRIAPEVRTVFHRSPWPGNVGQLKQVIERACVVAPDQVIHLADLPEAMRSPTAGELPTGAGGHLPITSLAAIERLHILRVLEHCGGNKKAAAEVLEIDRSTLYAKLRQYGVG